MHLWQTSKEQQMKTPLPEHPEPHTYTWTKLEEESIRAAMVAAYNERAEDNTILRGLIKEARKIIRASSSRSITKDWDERATDALKEQTP